LEELVIKKCSQITDKQGRQMLRTCRWKEWKKIKTKARNLMTLDIEREEAWKNANSSKWYRCFLAIGEWYLKRISGRSRESVKDSRLLLLLFQYAQLI
jgi:hypothetical protein